MEALTKHTASGSAASAATSAVAACAGRLAGLAFAGETVSIADRTGVLMFGIVFLCAIARGRRDRGDPALRFACDVVTAVGAAAIFYLVPGMMRI